MSINSRSPTHTNMSDVAHGFGGYVVVSMSRAFDHLEVVVAKSLLQMPVFRQDHFVAFAQGVRVTPSQMEGFRADVERLSAEFRAEPLTRAIRARALAEASALAARFPVDADEGAPA